MITTYASLPSERDDIRRINRAAGNFAGEELNTPEGMFDEYVVSPQQSGYYFVSAQCDGVVAGFACYGPTSFTDATFDLYWIAADASTHGRGVGKALFAHVLNEIKNKNGKLLVIWTSGTAQYQRARDFYLRMGCQLEARIKNFYRAGDDLCVFVYRLDEI